MRVSLDCKPIALQFTRTIPSPILSVCVYVRVQQFNLHLNKFPWKTLPLIYHCLSLPFSAPSNFTSHPFRFLPQNRSRFFNFNFFLSFDIVNNAQSKMYIYIFFFIISPTNKVREKIKRLFLLLGWIALSSAFNQWPDRGPDIRTIAYCACETMKSLSVEELTLNIVKRERIRFVKKMFRGIKRETMYMHSYASPGNKGQGNISFKGEIPLYS